ncbi:MAG: hypothetical protein SVY53_02870 [Chloroflexota bacterium]|nr:hypothetical protein [Chloroflexota bacterium]
MQAEELEDHLSLQSESTNELLEWYEIAKEIDFLLVYNTGGFGGSPIEQDEEWPTVLEAVQSELASLGCTSDIVEFKRGGYGSGEIIPTIGDMFNMFSETAPELAGRLGFLLKYCPELKVIITGRSTGAAFCKEVMLLLEPETNIYSIQAGLPVWYNSSAKDERTFIIEEDDDPLSNGNIGVLIKHNLGRIPTTTPPEEGSLQILSWYLKVPGHAFNWDLMGEEGQHKLIGFIESIVEERNG